MIHHRHFLRELVFSVLSLNVLACLGQVHHPEESSATQGLALGSVSVCAIRAVQVVSPAVQVRRLAPYPCPLWKVLWEDGMAHCRHQGVKKEQLPGRQVQLVRAHHAALVTSCCASTLKMRSHQTNEARLE